MVTLLMTTASRRWQQMGLYQRRVVILVMFKILKNIRKYSWKQSKTVKW